MEPKVDLSKLMKMVDSHKETLASKEIAEGRAPVNAVKKSGRGFLSELKRGMQNGIKTEAVIALQQVNETVEQRHGTVGTSGAQPQSQQRPQQRQQPRPQQLNEGPAPVRRSGDEWSVPGVTAPQNGGNNQQGGYDDRDQAFDQRFQQQNEQFDLQMRNRNPIGQQIMPNAPQQYSEPQYGNPLPTQHAGNINEQVERMVNERLERSMERMVENSFRSVLTNIYTKQKIQEALGDFLSSAEFVDVVKNAINEIARHQKKAK